MTNEIMGGYLSQGYDLESEGNSVTGVWTCLLRCHSSSLATTQQWLAANNLSNRNNHLKPYSISINSVYLKLYNCVQINSIR